MTSLTRLSLANRLIVGMVTVAIVVFGILAATSLRQELLPSTQVPSATVTAVYPGATPEIVAEEVAKPLGEAIGGVSGVTKVSSVSTNGLARLSVEWTYGLKNEDLVSDIRTAGDSITLPTDVTFDVLAGSTDDIPVLVLAVSSDAPLQDLVRQTDELVTPKLSGVDGVRQVQVSGQDTTELSITLRPAKLRTYDLDPAAVTQVVQAQAQAIPAGNSFSGDTELAIQVGSSPTSVKQVRGWAVPAPDGPVKLSQIADVETQSVEATTVARASGRPALSISVLKESKADSVEVSKTISALLPTLTDNLGQNASVQVVFDQAPSIQKSIHDLTIEGGLGLAFAVLVILVFLLSVRSTLITAISIPLSLLIAMIGLKVTDYSLNIFTLAAMTVAVGRVVDDSIVVIENIKRRYTGPGPLTPAAIVASVREVAGAVTASTLTTVAVFLPVAIVSGITGELFRPFSITVGIALAASLLVSMTIVPVLAYWFLRSSPIKHGTGRASEAEGGEDQVTTMQRGYLPLLRFALRRPLITVLAAVLIFGGTMASATLLKTNFLDSFADKTTLQIDQQLPVGTRLSTTSDAAKQVESILDASPGVKEYLTTIGQGGSNRASMFVSLTGEDAYDDTLPALKASFAELAGAGEVKIGSINTGTSNDLSYTVSGDDPKSLAQAAGLVENTLKATPGLTEVSSDLTDRRPFLKVDVDQTKAATRGFTSAEIGQTIANALRGTKVGTVVLEGDSRDIMIRPQDAAPQSPKQVAGLELPVSQLQQQQAVDKASKKLEKKGDKLEAKGKRLTKSNEALGDRQEDLGERQKAVAQEQQDEGLDAAADQRSELRSGLSDARDSVTSTKRQLNKLLDSPPLSVPAGATGPGAAKPAAQPPESPGPPGAPRQPSAADQPQLVTADQLAAIQAQQRWQQQVAQLRGALVQGEAQVEGLVSQLDAGEEQADKSAAQISQQSKFTDEQESLTDRQKELGTSQQDLGDAQTTLAEKQGDLADVRAKPIKVSDIAKVREKLAPSAVTQLDGVRAVTLTATPDTDNLGELTTTVQTKLDALDLPGGIEIKTGGASQDQADAFRQLGLAMVLAIVIVFMIMVATFRSLLQPLILLTSIPFAATGAVGGLLVTGTPLGVPAMVGLLMLIGIVVTNAIVLIDLINKKRSSGESLYDGVLLGARLRLRPIVMTATATICALIPMGLGITGGGAFISKPLAVVVIGGLLSSTLLTLLLVPALYTLAERRGERKRLGADTRDTGNSGDRPQDQPATA